VSLFISSKVTANTPGKFILALFFISLQSSLALPGDSLKVGRPKLGIVIKADLLSLGLTAIENQYKLKHYPGNRSQEYIYSLTGEKLFFQHQSVQLCWLAYNYQYAQTNGIIPRKRNWIVVAPEYKYFVTQRRDHSGLYVGANLKYIRLYNQDTYVSYLNNSSGYDVYWRLSHSAGLGFITGCQFSAKRGFTFDLLGNIGFFTELRYTYYDGTQTNSFFGSGFYRSWDHVYDLGIYRRNDPFCIDFRVAINLGYKF
jgi:hypothetical protein